MKYLKYTLAISLMAIAGTQRMEACGPFYPEKPNHIKMFRSCSPELESQWQEGCRFQDYEKEENCLLWQNITSPSIPLDDIERVIYTAGLRDLQDLPAGSLSDNKFAQWLCMPGHAEDLEYVSMAKEIEEIRAHMANPWYYAYDEDEEHVRLDELMRKCRTYTGKRHADRYALQLMRLHFSAGDFKSCRELWENSISNMPANIITDMATSYAGGAYYRCGNRDKAIELYTRSQDIGSLITLKAWGDTEEESEYTDTRVKQLEYIFNRFPNSPLLGIKLQEHVRNRESFVYGYEIWAARDFHDPVEVKTRREGDSLVTDDERAFYDELKNFARKAVSSDKCRQKGMWLYTLGYLYYLDGNTGKAETWLGKAEHADATPFIKESIHAFRILMDAGHANSSSAYRRKLLRHLKWLDERMKKDAPLHPDRMWQFDNKMNQPVCYWQDVARKVLLGEVCPKMRQAGNTPLALQLANYATNRIHQLSPQYEALYTGWSDSTGYEYYTKTIPFDEYRKTWPGRNYHDFSSQFFNAIYDAKADDAARYAEKIDKPASDLDRFLNARSYVDHDYIFEIVGTLYLREMDYEKASYWLSRVSTGYQSRTNIAKEGYFRLDPFRYQADKAYFIADSCDYKLRFAQEMVCLDNIIHSNAEANRKAEAKIRFAIGLRNSFGKCWYLTEYGHNIFLGSDGENVRGGRWYTSADREGFRNNTFAQEAYTRVDTMIKEAIAEFTDPEKAAQAQLEMMNHATLMKTYPGTQAAEYIRTRCDNYHDYALQKR